MLLQSDNNSYERKCDSYQNHQCDDHRNCPEVVTLNTCRFEAT